MLETIEMILIWVEVVVVVYLVVSLLWEGI